MCQSGIIYYFIEWLDLTFDLLRIILVLQNGHYYYKEFVVGTARYNYNSVFFLISSI